MKAVSFYNTYSPQTNAVMDSVVISPDTQTGQTLLQASLKSKMNN